MYQNLVFVTCFLILASAGVGRTAPEAPKRSAAELGTIVIVPFLDISGERQESKNEYRETALSEVEERCRRYEIQYLSRQEVAAAMERLKMASTDEEDRTKQRLKQLADELKARYVLTGTIHGADSKISQRGFFGGGGKAGQSRVQFRVYDAQEGRWVEEWELTATSTARQSAFSSPLIGRSSKLRGKAVRDATKKAMADFLKPFPKLHEQDPGEK